MKRLTVLLTVCLMVLATSAQDDARQWLKQGEWRCGFTKAKPHKTLNTSEFYSQYKKNTKQWETLFQWLRDTDLETIPKGKHLHLLPVLRIRRTVHWRSVTPRVIAAR